MLAEATTATTLHPIWNALIMAVSAAAAVAIPLWFKGRQEARAKAQEIAAVAAARKEDWAREDAVAKQAAEAAQLLLDRQALDSKKMAEAAQLLLESNDRVAVNAGEVKDRLDVIHDLVNSK